MANCIYCGAIAESVEHPLPAAFGEFLNAPLLTDRICGPCNTKRLGILDEQFARCGPEAVLRRILRIEGRSTHEKINPHHRGSAGGGRLATEPYFADIRSFITATGAKVRLANKFMGRRPTPLLGNMLGGARPDGWFAHVLTAEANADTYLGHVQVFISEEYSATAYTVTLAKGLSQVERAAYGHAYRYYRNGKQGRFSGEAIRLSTTFSSIPRQPLLPLFEEMDSMG